MAQSMIQAKLCPHCANSVALDAVQCPYCKAALSTAPAHDWPERTNEPVAAKPSARGDQRGKKTLAMIAAAVLVAALGAVVLVGQWQRRDRLSGVGGDFPELQEKDQKIQTLEAELAKLREGNQGSSSQLDELKAKLEEAEKDLTSTQRKLADANREIERLNSNRVASAPPPPAPREILPAPTPPSAAPARRGAEPGVYETRRATTVYEEPIGSARAVTQIAKGTEVTVVRSVGEWLEVRSKHGNPPGFIRVDDAMLIRRAN